MVPERVRGQRCSQCARHEAHFDERPNAVGEQAVINLIDVGPIVDRPALGVFGVDAHFVVEDGVEANITNVGGRFHGPQVAPIAFAQRQDRPARAKHLFPVVWKRAGGRSRVDRHFLGGRCLLA